MPAFAPGDLEKVIAARVREHRQGAGLSLADLAQLVGLSRGMLSKIENAQTSCSLTTLGRLADGLQVPVSALIRGVDTPRSAVHTPAGQGIHIVRRGSRAGHDYALLGTHQRLEAVIVTVTESGETLPSFQHPGTEFLYMLEGEMVYDHGGVSYTLRPGDALQLEGEAPHGPERLVQLPIRFLSITAFDKPPRR